MHPWIPANAGMTKVELSGLFVLDVDCEGLQETSFCG